MAFKRAKQREPLGEAGLFEYAVSMLARRMRTERRRGDASCFCWSRWDNCSRLR